VKISPAWLFTAPGPGGEVNRLPGGRINSPCAAGEGRRRRDGHGSSGPHCPSSPRRAWVFKSGQARGQGPADSAFEQGRRRRWTVTVKAPTTFMPPYPAHGQDRPPGRPRKARRRPGIAKVLEKSVPSSKNAPAFFDALLCRSSLPHAPEA